MPQRKKSTNRKDQLTEAQAEHLQRTLHGIRDEVLHGNLAQAREEYRALERGLLDEGVVIHRTKAFMEFCLQPETRKMLDIFWGAWEKETKELKERQRGQKA